MVLTIDVGNTRIKGAVFEGYNKIEFFVFPKDEIEKNIDAVLKKYKEVQHLVVASVGNIDRNSFLYFQNELEVWFVSHTDTFPFVNNYATPNTLGIDRMVLAAGATLQFQGQNRLIIDAGTCVTYDFVDQNDVYHGGAISPGLRLRYESLHTFTEKLPLLTVKNPKDFVGDSTAEAIHSGIVNGLVYEINGFVDEYQSKYSNFIIILTGGDTEFLAKRLKNTIFANSNFLLESLNQIFQYKIEND
jgi:type III pantothenate kinase